MKDLPDTNLWSFYLRAMDSRLTDQVEVAMLAGELVMSAIVLAELDYGAEKARLRGELRPIQRLTRLRQAITATSFDQSAATAYGHLRSDLERRGLTIGSLDMLVAAHALALGAAIVTHNVREFSRIPGLVVEDWQTEI